MLTIAILYIPSLNTTHIAKKLEYVFMFLPQYDVGSGIIGLFSNYKMLKLCKSLGFDHEIMVIICKNANDTGSDLPCCGGKYSSHLGKLIDFDLRPL